MNNIININEIKMQQAFPKFKTSYSTIVSNKLHPNFVTGFADGEASYKVSIYKKKECKTGWWVIPTFTIEVHEKDAILLNQIKTFFGVGTINVRKKNNQVIYTVGGVKDLVEVIIPHFLKYPLLTQKWQDFVLFKLAVDLINQKEHLTMVGLRKIVSIRASMNKGLTETLLECFPDITPLGRPERGVQLENPSPYWLAGFVDAEGCFLVSVQKSKSHTIGFQTQPKFIITQHDRDIKLMESFIKIFNCGRLQVGPKSVYFVVSKVADLESKISPFFNKYPLLGQKKLEFMDFCKVVALMKTKSHLTESGLQQILVIRSGMNTKRNHMVILDTNISYPNFEGITNSISKIQKRTFHTHVKAAKRIGPHHMDVYSVIIGSLLGNCVSSKLVEGTRFVFRTSIVKKNYLFWLYAFFYSRGYASNLEPRMYTRKLKKGDEVKEYYGYEFNTFTFRSFNWIYEMFYNKGKKVISLKIEKYLTPLALAVWIMDDGGWAKPGTRIATNSFKLEEVEFLASVLRKNFDLDCTVQKIGTIDQYSIYIKGSSIPALRKLVLPYLHPSMHYKVGLKA